MATHVPHPANVPGDFYVEDGCCTTCEVPLADAPALFAYTNDPKGYLHCYVKRQPRSPADVDAMLAAISHAEMRCIRYRGRDELIELRLIRGGDRDIIDDLSEPPVGRDELAARLADRLREATVVVKTVNPDYCSWEVEVLQGRHHVVVCGGSRSGFGATDLNNLREDANPFGPYDWPLSSAEEAIAFVCRALEQ